LGLEGTRDFQAAQEAVADSDGKFYLPVAPGSNLNPVSYTRKEPEIVIYHPGYEPTWAGWRTRNKFKTTTEFVEALKKGITIKLQKLKTKDQLAKFSDRSSFAFSPDVGVQQVPTLMQAINIQRKILGFKPIY
jgi:hypothetical protein